MVYLLLGFVFLAVVLAVLRGFTQADVHKIAVALRMVGGVAALAAAGVLLVRGLATYAAPLAAIGTWLLWGHPQLPKGGTGAPGGPAASRIVTATLEAELEHSTGTLRGQVRTGPYAGRALDDMTPAELADLWRDCRFSDPQSAQILEAWLDRLHPNWQQDAARAGDGSAGHRAPPTEPPGMTREEAFAILGLERGASEETIRQAHRELMTKNHPDRGGSTYLAAKINQARDVLLGS